MASGMNETNTGDGEANEVNKNPNDTLEARKKKIKDDINELKDLIYQIECNMKIAQFKEIQKNAEPEESFSVNSQMMQNMTDVEIVIQNDLYRYMGLYCAKIGESYIFNFISTSVCTKNDVYAVQILNQDGVGKLGNWVMPFSIDTNQILQETSLEKLHEFPLFLRNCKRKLDYHYFRMIQFQDFKAFLSDFKNCKLDTNLGYTQIILELVEVMEIESGRSYNIVLYFQYESDDIRPCNLIIDSLTGSELSDEEVKKFKKFFRHFKNFELKVAFETALDTAHTVFLWNKEPVESDLVELSDNDEYISIYKRKRKNQSKESNKKRPRINESNTSNLHSSQESEEEEYHSESKNISQTKSAGVKITKPKNMRAVKSKTRGTIEKVHQQDLMEAKNNSNELLSIQKEKRKTKTILKEVRDNSKLLKKKSKGADPKQRTLNFGTPLENNVDKTKNMAVRRKSIKWADEILENDKENEPTSVITNINEDIFIPTSTPIGKNKRKKDLIVPVEQEISVINKAIDTFPLPDGSETKTGQNVDGEQSSKDLTNVRINSNESRDTNSETEVETDIDQEKLLNELKSTKEKKSTVIAKKQKGKSSFSVKKSTKNETTKRM